jgi:hypothetical protein
MAMTVHPCSNHARTGNVLPVVLGLMAILIALLLALVMQVHGSLAGIVPYQRSVEAYVMLQAAKLELLGRRGDGTLSSAGAVTAGDQLDLAVRGWPYATSLGWMHLTPEAGNTNVFDVVATGGAAGAGGAKSGTAGSIDAGDPTANACEVRLFYRVTFAPGAGASTAFTVQLQDVADNHLYPW